jgi:hypothetical protein
MESAMALKGQISLTLLAASFLALVLALWFSTTSAGATGNVSARPSGFRSDSQPVPSNHGEVILRGVRIHEDELSVVQQPAGNNNYVSKRHGEVTQFTSAARFGNIGLLAHNYLSGKSFSSLRIGQEIGLVYSDGTVEGFVVTEILRYKALEPKSPYSSFQNLDDPNEILTVGQMFDRAYQGGRHVTLQTCISAEGNASWGRLFILASPKTADLSLIPVHSTTFMGN